MTAAIVGDGVPLRVQPHQLGDPVLGDEDGASPGFGGMGGDHRRHQGTVQRVGHRGRIQLGRVQFHIGGGQAAVLRRLPGSHVNGAASPPVDVFGDVGQQGEMAERPDDRNGLVDVDAVEHPRHLGPVDLGVTHLERCHPGTLDEVEDLFTVLLAHGVAEDGAQHPDVGAHRFGRLAAQPGPMDIADRFERGVGNLNHAFQYRCATSAPPADRKRQI